MGVMNNISKDYTYGLSKDEKRIVKGLDFLDLVKYILSNDVDFDKVTFGYRKLNFERDFFIGNKKEFLETLVKDKDLEKRFYSSSYYSLYKDNELIYIGSRKDIIEYLKKNDLDNLVLTTMSKRVISKGSSKDIFKQLDEEAELDFRVNLYTSNKVTSEKTKKSPKIHKISKVLLTLLGIVNVFFIYQIAFLPLSLSTAYYFFVAGIANIVVLPNVINYERESRLDKEKHLESTRLADRIDEHLEESMTQYKNKYTYKYDKKPLNIEESKNLGNKTLSK